MIDEVTVITKDTESEHPAPFITLYDMVSVPAVTPVTTPPEFTVAILVFLLVQVPPAVELDNVVVVPTQT